MAELLFLTKRRRSKEGGLRLRWQCIYWVSFVSPSPLPPPFLPFLALQHPLLGKLPVILRVHVLRLKHRAVTHHSEIIALFHH